jgi:hypothetical protein
MLALLAVYCAAAAGYYRAIKTGDRSSCLIVTTAVVGLTALLLAILAAAAHFPFWGRHLAPVFPGVVIIVAISLASISSKQWVPPAIATTLYVILALSSWELRFAARHKKDDYRYAVQRVAVALSSGKRVWWFADVWASRYYGDGRYEELPQPDVIVLSKPDIYDKNASLRGFIRKAGYHPYAQAQAFEFFEK